MTCNIIVGDCVDVLKTLPSCSADCCITSPPYFGLRDYGVSGQIGLECSVDDFLAKMVEVFAEVRRVLRDDGTLWLNLGDSYASATGGARNSERWPKQARNEQRGRDKRAAGKANGIKPKDLMGIPWRVALALQADGWYLRQDIIWSKPNPMPESVLDRCTKSHEYIFLLSKGPQYYYDVEAVKEPISATSEARLAQDLENQMGSNRVPGKTNGPMKAVGKGNAKTFRGGGSYTGGNSFDNDAEKSRDSTSNVPNVTGLRNKRSVWEVATQGFKEAHFATFPPDLIVPCIKAGSRPGGLVLDPFGGAGTTGLVAARLQRSSVLIELNPGYAKIADRRIRDDSPLLVKVMVT